MKARMLYKLLLLLAAMPLCAEVRSGKAGKSPTKTTRSGRKKSPRIHVAIPQLSGGRFGDNLVSLSHTLYFALEHGLELRYIPFPYADQLQLANYYVPFSRDEKFAHYVTYASSLNMEAVKQKDAVLLQVGYFPISESEYTVPHTWRPFAVNWHNEKFITELRKIIAPKHPLTLTYPPEGKTSVAVHLRRGGSYDVNLPEEGLLTYKIPKDEFYINQIRNMVELIGVEQIYIYLFTDDDYPEELARKYQERLNIPGLEFHFREVGNNHYSNVLEDFFSLLNFECLIRSESNFAIMAEKIGNFKVVMSPALLEPGERIHRGITTIKE